MMLDERQVTHVRGEDVVIKLYSADYFQMLAVSLLIYTVEFEVDSCHLVHSVRK